MSVKTTCRDIGELTPKAQKACNLFLEECRRQGLDVLITETYRSQERQNYLYEQGRSREGKKVTWTKSSRHTSRRAWDICKNVKGAEYCDTKFFQKCGEIAKGFKITWGGEWKTPDTPHFEISEDWNYEEEEEMTQAEKKEFDSLKETVKKLNDKVWLLENPDVYEKENTPEWGKEAVSFFTENEILKGDDRGVKLSPLKVWVLVILYRIIKHLKKEHLLIALDKTVK